MLARHAACCFNLPKEDARKLRKAFEGGAGGEKSRKHEIAEERHGFFDARRLDIVASPCGMFGSGVANCALKWAISSGESAVCMGGAMKKRGVKQNLGNAHAPLFRAQR